MREGWEVKKLGDVTTYKSGTTIKKDLEKSSGDVLYVKVGDMNLEGNEIDITTSTRFVNSNDIKDSQIIPIGSVIFPKRGGAIATNKKRRIINPTIVDLNTMAISPKKILSSEYLFYWFKLIDLATISNGTSIPQINNYSFDNIFISFPKALPEQTQIVNTLDKAFKQIDQAKANLEKNLHNAKELFQSKLNEVFSQRGEGWVEKTLEATCSKIFAGGDAPKENFSKVETDEYSIPIYANAVKHRGLYGYTNIARVKEPSISISARGSGTGHTELRFHPFFPIVRLIVLIPNLELIELRFLKYAISTLDILRSGSAIPQLTVPMIKQYKVYVPKLSKQKDLIEELDNLATEIEKLQTHYKHKLYNLEELKKSILQKAFAGEL